MLFSLDYCIVYLFLVTLLGIGLYVKKSSIRNIKDYMLVGKEYGATALIITFLATTVGGGTTVGLAGGVYADGIIMMVAASGYFFAFLFIAKFIAPKMNFFSHCVTMGDIMEKFYGVPGKVITGTVGVLFSMGVVAGQALALGYVFASLFSIDKAASILVSGGIMVLYAAILNIQAITLMNIIQFVMLIVIIPIIANVGIKRVGGIGELLRVLHIEKFTIFSHGNFLKYLSIFLVWTVFPAMALSPPYIQKMLMAKNKQQIQQMFIVGTGFLFPFKLMITLIGLVAFVLYPHIDPNLALPNMINSILPMGIKGLAVAGLLAVIIANSYSFLNTGALLFSHDVLRPLCNGKKIVINELKFLKYIILAIGLGAIYIALRSNDVVALISYASGLLGALITIPFMAGILGLKTDLKSFIIAFLATFVTFLFCYLYFDSSQQYLTPCYSIVANGISFFVVHSIQNKGFVLAHPSQGNTVRIKINWEKAIHWVQGAMPTPNNMRNYATKKVKKYGASYNLFAIFWLLNYLFPYFMWTSTQPLHYHTMLTMRLMAGLWCAWLLLRQYWPTRFKPYFPLYWHMTVMYCLPFMTTIAFMLTGGSTDWLVNIALAIMLLAALVDWVSFIFLSITGVSLGFIVYSLVLSKLRLEGITMPSINFTTMYLLVYACVFATLISLLFLRKREKDLEKKLQGMAQFGGSIAHHVSNVVGLGQYYANVLMTFLNAESVEKYQHKDGRKGYFLDEKIYEEIYSLIKTLHKDSNKSVLTMNRLVAILKPDVVPDDVGVYSIKACIQQALAEYELENFQCDYINLDVTHDFQFNGSAHYMKYVLFCLLNNAYNHVGEDCKIDIWLGQDHTLHFKDNGPGIDQERLPYIFDYFYTTDRAGAGVGLSFCKMIMEKFKGTITCRSQQEESAYTEFILKFSLVQDLRT